MLTDENGLNISQRNVTVSTCGIVPKMYELAEEKLQITLALSLHATTDEKRRRLMPIANKYGMKELMDACRNYADKTGRRLTFEYSLVGGVNDTKEDAEELIGLAAPLRWEGTSTGRADSCAADTWKSRASEPSRKRTMPDNSLSFLYFCASMVKIMGEIPNTERVSE